VAEDVDNLTIIQEELEKYGGRQSATSSSKLVCCAFHDEKAPSCSINMSFSKINKYGKPVSIGHYYCFGCGVHGPWNVFAEKAGLQKVKEWNSKEGAVHDTISNEEEEALLGESGTTLKSLLKAMRKEEAQPWPESIEWRGYNGAFIRKLGGLIANDEFNESVSLVFPVKVNGKIRGGVTAVFERKSKSQLAYMTARGEWAMKYALFPYDHVKKMIEDDELNFVILVEGPRDALRLISMGLPALAILGSKVFSKMKALLIVSLGIEIVYLMPDNDSGGKQMVKTIKGVMNELPVKLTKISLPRKLDEEGKLIKVDPNNMSKQVANKLLATLRRRHYS